MTVSAPRLADQMVREPTYRDGDFVTLLDDVPTAGRSLFAGEEYAVRQSWFLRNEEFLTLESRAGEIVVCGLPVARVAGF